MGDNKMERWNIKNGCDKENTNIDAFIEEIIEISKKHGLSISHEDTYGAFTVEKYSEDNAEWLRGAHDAT